MGRHRKLAWAARRDGEEGGRGEGRRKDVHRQTVAGSEKKHTRTVPRTGALEARDWSGPLSPFNAGEGLDPAAT